MRNLIFFIDLYQFIMLNGYFEKNIYEDIVVFDMFFRKNVCDGGYIIVCGIDQVVEYIDNFYFLDEDLEYLKNLNLFFDKFLKFLKEFKFIGDIYVVEEGIIMFFNELLIIVKVFLY